MKVSTSQPFQLIYSLFEHEYLGYLFESYVVHVDDYGKLTFQHQNISAKNADEFSSGLDDKDYQLIDLIDQIQQDYIIRKFSKKVVKPEEFFLKVYDKEKGNKMLQSEIERYLEVKRSKILSLMVGKEVYEMGSDGEPAWKKLNIDDKKATVLFHFRKNDDNTHYFPTIKFDGAKIDFQYKGAFIVCKQPAWMVLDGNMFTFEKEVDGNKLQPFLNKKFIVIPKKVEEQYFDKFVAPLIESFDVYAKGFEILTVNKPVKPLMQLSILKSQASTGMFDSGTVQLEEDKAVLELNFRYEDFNFKADKPGEINVKMVKEGENYIFHRVCRDVEKEKSIIRSLQESGLTFNHAKAVMTKPQAFDWIKNNQEFLERFEMEVRQRETSGGTYFLGEPTIHIEISEAIDWFDVKAEIRFGEYLIPFNRLRKYILKKQTEFELPNGEIAVIPESWLVEYGDLFSLSEALDDSDETKIEKHHVALVKELEAGNLAKLQISEKLNKLRDFEKIDNFDLPGKFKGELRPYQKAGYNWLRFLNDFKFGACLADDMGLGKTVQALALLESQKELNPGATSLLVLPTSLVYNWEKEAEKFTPGLNVFCYTGTHRNKDPESFNKYDLIITSYGIIRLDIELLENYYFNYIILDESQAIKNPSSFISKAVRRLKGNSRLILTGTPLENSTMDLWSQMDFVNPGMLGTKSYFKNEFQIPID